MTSKSKPDNDILKADIARSREEIRRNQRPELKPLPLEGRWAEVKSSNIRAVKWERILEVKFHGGRVYRYTGVPEKVWKEMLSAGSHGEFLATRIMKKYKFVEITDDKHRR
jgi:hypothetical protein